MAFRDAASGASGRASPLDQMLNQVLENRGIQLVSNLLTMALGYDQASVAEHGKMPGDGRPARAEASGDISRSKGPITQQPEDVTSGLVGECAKRLIRGTHSAFCPCMISKVANYNLLVKRSSRPTPA